MPAPVRRSPVHARYAMSIDKDSSGFPQVNPHKRTTKVNYSIIVAIVVFFTAMSGVIWWLATTRS